MPILLFLQMFTIPFLKGDANTALDAPNKMVISEDLSQKYFGQTDPSGRLMTVHEGGHISLHYVITGVFKNYPKNSHLAFDYLISYKTFISLIHFLGKGKEADPDLGLGWYDFYDYLCSCNRARTSKPWKPNSRISVCAIK